MSRFPQFHCHRVRCIGREPRPGQLVIGGHDVRAPVIVAMLNGIGQQEQFDRGARMHQIEQITPGELGHAEAPLALIADQSFAAEKHQGLADRAHAEFVAFLQCLQAKLFPRGQAARDDVCAQQLIRLLGNGLGRRRLCVLQPARQIGSPHDLLLDG
ncbi:hypothetical protein D3C86_1648620 [compost metagenome]